MASVNDLVHDYFSMDETVTAYGTVTNPGAATVICETAAVLPVGLYRFDCYAYYGGSGPVAADVDNFVLKFGSTIKGRILSVTASQPASAKAPITYHFRADGTTKASLSSVNAAGAATVEYRALLIARRVSS